MNSRWPAVLRPTRQSARVVEIVAREVVAPVLVDAEQPAVGLVAVAPVVPVGVAAHGDVGDLDQRLVLMMPADRPRLY
jgi:hypothetical protein